MARLLALLVLGATAEECQHGYAFLNTPSVLTDAQPTAQSSAQSPGGVLARVAAKSAQHCQKSCVLQASCNFFVFDSSTLQCSLLATYVDLVQQDTAVSGDVHCSLEANAEETEEEQKDRISNSVVAMAKFVIERSTDPEAVDIAEHLAWSVDNGFLADTSYASIARVSTATSMLISSPTEFRNAAAQGMLLTRSDLDWLLRNTEGRNTSPEEKAETQGDLVDGGHGGILGGDVGHSSLESHGVGQPWTNAEVKYCFDQYIAESARQAAECAMGRIRSNVPGIAFIDVGYTGQGRCASVPAVFIQSSDNGCWANIGMSASLFGFGSNQKLNLQTPGCNDCGTATHEILHALGMAHEQSRPDRDTYISVLWNNIKPGMEDQFTKNSKADISRPYDIMSIMHYGSMSFTKNGQETILVKPAGYSLYTDDPGRYRYFRIGQRMHMSKEDVGQLVDLYRCEGEYNEICMSNGGGSGPLAPSGPTPTDPTNPTGGGGSLIVGPDLSGEQLVMLFIAAVASFVISACMCCICCRASGYGRL
ncbi:unnamed protein product [Effrenium voratum]|uniref:Metalloendopeptidase n=1 Tax=Effrenium voratum TaxID=2562239 RepID=A0AA36J654_9DINO|nr:unnamed protein product [Effrenium voratum]